MSKVIWKYTLSADTTLQIPAGGQVLSVHSQQTAWKEEVCIWVLVDQGMPTETRRFVIYGTGHTIPDSQMGDPLDMKYIGTAHVHDGNLVLHVFELI